MKQVFKKILFIVMIVIIIVFACCGLAVVILNSELIVVNLLVAEFEGVSVGQALLIAFVLGGSLGVVVSSGVGAVIKLFNLQSKVKKLNRKVDELSELSNQSSGKAV